MQNSPTESAEPNAKIESEMGQNVVAVQPENKAKPNPVTLRVAKRKPKNVQQRSSDRRAPSFPHCYPTTPTMTPVDGHHYRCEHCIFLTKARWQCAKIVLDMIIRIDIYVSIAIVALITLGNDAI